jgi:hypothetical protein
MRFAVSAFMLLLLANPCNAALVSIAYEGVVTLVGSAVPVNFQIGERIVGQCVYDTLAEAVPDSWNGPHYAAIRQLALRSEGGFFASINSGTISPFKSSSVYNHFPDVFLATSVPPIVLQSEEPSGPITGDLPDIIQYGPSLDAAVQATLASQALGFPGPAGAFLDLLPPAITLTLRGYDMLTSGSLAPPPMLSSAESAIGAIMFDPWPNSSSAHRVEFALTRFAVVPEPVAAKLIGISIFISVGLLRACRWAPPARSRAR